MLFERVRPTTLNKVVGQDDTVRSLQSLLARNAIDGALYLIGDSGTGKTTIARALCNELQVHDMDLTQCGGADCTADFVRSLIPNFALSTWGENGWKAVIVDEAHAMSKQAVQVWLPFLESLGKKRLVIFTSTETPEADMFGNFTAPLLSRCKVYNLKFNVRQFAEHVAAVATRENLNGQPIEAYERLLSDCKGNMRQALQRVDAGEMCQTLNIEKITTDEVYQPNVGSEDRLSSCIPIGTGSIMPSLSPTEFEREMKSATDALHRLRFVKGTKRYQEALDRVNALNVQRGPFPVA